MVANGLPQEILRILTERSFPAPRLELEITERTLIDPSREAKPVLESLRNLGVKLALDDFGAGYANLSYLRDFQFDRVKIDRLFVTELLRNPKHLLIVETIIKFCHALGMQTTAEGIESFELADRLTQLGCDFGQGFVFCRPKPNNELLKYFQARNAVYRKTA
jgi:EAL domain-containing protein (putative c-di-GMP-specific phosphodiesterase class I)